jgi:hypothetical protein
MPLTGIRLLCPSWQARTLAGLRFGAISYVSLRPGGLRPEWPLQGASNQKGQRMTDGMKPGDDIIIGCKAIDGQIAIAFLTLDETVISVALFPVKSVMEFRDELNKLIVQLNN